MTLRIDNTQVSLNQTLKAGPEAGQNNSNKPSEFPQGESNKQQTVKLTPDEIKSLRELTRSIQEVQKELGIESYAAVFDPISSFFEGLTLGTKIFLAGATWIASIFSPEIVRFIENKIQKPLGKYWNDELFSTSVKKDVNGCTVREKAIKDLMEAQIEKPEEVVQCLEFTLREYLIGSLKVPQSQLGDQQRDIRQVTGALEALYKCAELNSKVKLIKF